MSWTVEKIWVAERHMAGAYSNLLRDIFQDNIALHDPECTVVNRDHWAMTAPMLATAASLGIAGYNVRPI
jgi:hypothetical protein